MSECVYLHTININSGRVGDAGNSISGNTLVQSTILGMNTTDVQMTDNLTSWTQILSYHQPKKYLEKILSFGISWSLGTRLFDLKILNWVFQFYQKQNVQMSDKVSIYYPSVWPIIDPLLTFCFEWY